MVNTKFFLLEKDAFLESANRFEGCDVNEAVVVMLSTDYLLGFFLSKLLFFWVKNDPSCLCLGIKGHADV